MNLGSPHSARAISDRIPANSISRRSPTPAISSLRVSIPSGREPNPLGAFLCLQSCTLQLLHTVKMQPWALVTPASRGIGLELARRLLRTTDIPIVTSARKDLDQTREKVLSGLDGISEDRLHVLKVDILGMLTSLHKLVTATLSLTRDVPQTNRPSSMPLRQSHLHSQRSPPTSTLHSLSPASCTQRSRLVRSTTTMPYEPSRPTLSGP